MSLTETGKLENKVNKGATPRGSISLDKGYTQSGGVFEVEMSGSVHYYGPGHSVDDINTMSVLALNHHRSNGPSEVSSMGNISFSEDGYRHREDGPAVYYSDGGEVEFYIKDVLLKEGDFLMRT